MTLHSTFRLALTAAATLTSVAIVLGRAYPEPTRRRTESAAPYQVLNKTLSALVVNGPRLLGVETGRLDVSSRSPESSLDKVSLSPWEDQGSRQAIGLGSDRSSVSMIRLALPGGEVLNRVDFTRYALPNAAPCWFPGTLARVLYPGADGQIYRLDFEADGADGKVGDVADIQPRALKWRAPVPPEGVPAVGELSWSDDAPAGGRLLASVRFKRKGHRKFLDWRIWWFELDQDGMSIVAAGPMFPSMGEGEAGSLRNPSLIRDAGGDPALAYLARSPEQAGYQLKVAPVRFDPRSGAPLALDSEARTLAEGCLLVTPVATLDGRWLTVIRPDGLSVKAERLLLGGERTLVAKLP